MFIEGFSPSWGETGTCSSVAKNRENLSLPHVMVPEYHPFPSLPLAQAEQPSQLLAKPDLGKARDPRSLPWGSAAAPQITGLVYDHSKCLREQARVYGISSQFDPGSASQMLD